MEQIAVQAELPTSSRPLRRIGRYPLMRLLGQGSTGEVWLSEHPELGFPVAVKFLHPHLLGTSTEAAERFAREIKATVQVRHTNVVIPHDTGVDNGIPFLVVEFLSGGTVADLLADADGPLPLKTAIEIAMDVAKALDALSRNGIVHRDVKPSNIMLDEYGTAKLTDLGVAKLVGLSSTSLTASDMLVGTPTYLAPEQVSPDAPIDVRTDIYALGATLYQLATGVPPFSADNAIQMARCQLESIPIPAKERNPGLPEDVCRVIHRMLEKSPADRYQTAAELLVDLTSLLNDVTGRCPRPSVMRPRRSGLFRRTPRRLAWSALIVVVALLLGWSLRENAVGAPPAAAVSVPTDAAAVTPPPETPARTGHQQAKKTCHCGVGDLADSTPVHPPHFLHPHLRAPGRHPGLAARD